MSKDNDGPAFPIPLNPGSRYQGYAGEVDGMTLRDYFAAKAMAACISNMKGSLGVGYAVNNENLAMASYAIADAMLAERAQ